MYMVLISLSHSLKSTIPDSFKVGGCRFLSNYKKSTKYSRNEAKRDSFQEFIADTSNTEGILKVVSDTMKN